MSLSQEGFVYVNVGMIDRLISEYCAVFPNLVL